MSSPVDLDAMVCFALYGATRTLQQAYRPLLVELDLTYPQYLVLIALWEEDDRTVTDLGHRLMLDSGTLSPLLRRLEARGVIRRTPSETDGRSSRVGLTAEGRALQAKAPHIQQCLSASVPMSAEEIDTLRDLAQRVAVTTTTPTQQRNPS